MKFVLSGYFGFGNFGDEAILKYSLDILRYYYKESKISVITQNPYITKKTYNVNETIYRFEFKKIISEIKSCDVLLFPGGSILQDITSIKSILYYLAIIFLGLFYKKKVIMLSQGIGPISSNFARNLAYKLLKKTSLITVRDEKSNDLLMKNGVMCELTADLLWAFTQKTAANDEKTPIIYGDLACNTEKKKIAIQLRKWKNLSEEKLNIMAKNVLKSFPMVEFDYKLLCLQKGSDEEILIRLGEIMHHLQPEASIELCIEKDTAKTVELIQSVDYVIAMRFHAGLCAINAEKHLLVLSYDPKTEEFCNELGLQYLDVKDIDDNNFKNAIKWLKEFNPAKTALKTNILVKKSQQNVDFLIKELDK